VTASMPMREQNARRFVAIAATLGVLGVAFNLNDEGATLPKILAGLGVVSLIWSIHRFGRLGPDATIVYDEPEEAAVPKKKKKKKKKPAESPTSGSVPTPDDSSDAG